MVCDFILQPRSNEEVQTTKMGRIQRLQIFLLEKTGKGCDEGSTDLGGKPGSLRDRLL